ncbi:hypothetical protein ABE438_16320 [Bosea sp. TWI1241]|uniref:hypothetical protein n=1 Tax=Bosea sp. TWI1241 TaxID=3148904 RepID=UPI003209220B
MAAETICGDEDLGYRRSLSDFAEPLRLDESYRRAHLPLLRPEHPGVIAHDAERGYLMGRHEAIFSLVMMLPAEALAASPAFAAFEAELRAAPFAAKIAWDLQPKRADRLHATVVGTLSRGTPPLIAPETRRALAALGPFEVVLRGPFSGTVNRGRLYLRTYPALGDGANPLQVIQQEFGRAPGDLWLVGLYNLVADLDAAETAALGHLVARWWDRDLLRLTVRDLAVMGAHDDLVLDSRIVETLPLAASESRQPQGEQP